MLYSVAGSLYRSSAHASSSVSLGAQPTGTVVAAAVASHPRLRLKTKKALPEAGNSGMPAPHLAGGEAGVTGTGGGQGGEADGGSTSVLSAVTLPAGGMAVARHVAGVTGGGGRAGAGQVSTRERLRCLLLDTLRAMLRTDFSCKPTFTPDKTSPYVMTVIPQAATLVAGAGVPAAETEGGTEHAGATAAASGAAVAPRATGAAGASTSRRKSNAAPHSSRVSACMWLRLLKSREQELSSHGCSSGSSSAEIFHTMTQSGALIRS